MEQIYYQGASPENVLQLYACSSDVPPEHIDSPACEWIAELNHTIDLKQLSRFESKTLDGVNSWMMKYDVEVHMGSKEGTLDFRVQSGGKVLGKSEIRYDAERREKRGTRAHLSFDDIWKD